MKSGEVLKIIGGLILYTFRGLFAFAALAVCWIIISKAISVWKVAWHNPWYLEVVSWLLLLAWVVPAHFIVKMFMADVKMRSELTKKLFGNNNPPK